MCVRLHLMIALPLAALPYALLPFVHCACVYILYNAKSTLWACNAKCRNVCWILCITGGLIWLCDTPSNLRSPPQFNGFFYARINDLRNLRRDKFYCWKQRFFCGRVNSQSLSAQRRNYMHTKVWGREEAALCFCFYFVEQKIFGTRH